MLVGHCPYVGCTLLVYHSCDACRANVLGTRKHLGYLWVARNDALYGGDAPLDGQNTSYAEVTKVVYNLDSYLV